MNIGKRLTKLRKMKNITQLELADKLFITDKTISSWESNRTTPSLEMLVKLSEIFSCNVGYLIYGDNSKNDIETEIKIKITDKEYDELINFFKNNAKFLTESRQFDTYYQPTYRKFLNDREVNEWLRIGKRGNKKILNYNGRFFVAKFYC